MELRLNDQSHMPTRDTVRIAAVSDMHYGKQSQGTLQSLFSFDSENNPCCSGLRAITSSTATFVSVAVTARDLRKRRPSRKTKR